ncbi:MAG: T9SS type A sorting domain-containing protein [Bacteroidales bacterium]|nr:T9SS type A sorting domain-containing protein [Bacteroidales bacterium]
MKTIYKFLPLLILPLVLIVMANNNGSPGGRTGSVGDNGQNCTGCHAGTPQNATNWITTNIPPSGYVPGQTYTITATGTHTGVVKFGFELTAENSSGAKVGTLIITNATQTKLVNQNKAVTHLAAGTTPSGNTKTWSMGWTAPGSGTGPVIFSAAFNAANGNGGNSGDVIYLTSTTVQEQTSGVEVTFRVDMSEQTVSPLGVHIAGSFQGWDPGATEMTDTGNSIYAVTITLTEGEYIEYKFVNGNAWGMDESVPPGCAANNNRFLTVPAQNTTLEAVCFGSCTICNPGSVDVTFQVDMSNETVSPLGVHIAGSFQGWDPAGTLMTEVGNNVYAVTIELQIGGYYEYKFVNGNAWGMDETVPPQCASGWNRYITVPAVPVILDAVCFGSCDPCGPPPVDIEVTFRVDMTNEIISPEGVHIAGGFQGWNPGSTLMTDAGDNIYTYTTILPSGTYQEYKFINGTTWEQSENVPPPCGVNNNRFLTVPQSNIVLDLVCYGECDPCGPPPVEVEVTFVVDLSEEIVSPQGVHLAGSFQGWDPAGLPMTTAGDNIYQATVVFLSGTYIEYKFINGDTFEGAELVPEECGVDDGFGGFSRFYTVPDVNVTLPEVCFSSCTECSGVGIDQSKLNSEPLFYPNPASTKLYFNPVNDIQKVSLFSVEGKLLIEKILSHENLDISAFDRGLYFLKIETQTSAHIYKLIIN